MIGSGWLQAALGLQQLRCEEKGKEKESQGTREGAEVDRRRRRYSGEGFNFKPSAVEVWTQDRSVTVAYLQ